MASKNFRSSRRASSQIIWDKSLPSIIKTFCHIDFSLSLSSLSFSSQYSQYNTHLTHPFSGLSTLFDCDD